MSNNLKISLSSKLDITLDQEQKVKDFMKALNELPRSLDVKFSTDGGKNWGESNVKIDLMKLIGELYFGNESIEQN